MFETDPTRWAFTTWVLYILMAYYIVGFLVFYLRFELGERRARLEGGEAVLRFNRMIRGFPNAVFAKMFGKRAFETVKLDDRQAQ